MMLRINSLRGLMLPRSNRIASFSTNTLLKYHIPVSEADRAEMLKQFHLKKVSTLIGRVIPPDLLNLDRSRKQTENMNHVLASFYDLIALNKPGTCFIGQGFYPCFVPPIVKRCVLENPRWYTAYTPYQSEIAQGRLECLFNYQIMIKRLTGMDVANASLLDEASAAAEAVLMAFRLTNGTRHTFIMLDSVFEATQAVVKSYATEVGIKVIQAKQITPELINQYKDDLIGFLGQTPDRFGLLHDFESAIEIVKSAGGLSILGTDLLACVMLKPPGAIGADVVFGNGQRFGNPMGLGGPHAAFFAVRNQHIRQMPGRLISLAQDIHGKPAFRMSLQTREQHIRREKATSNICTSQVLLANLNFFYALYHGEQGLKDIATEVHQGATLLAQLLTKNGFNIYKPTQGFFDTVTVEIDNADIYFKKLQNSGITCHKAGERLLSISIDETKTQKQIISLVKKLCDKPAILNSLELDSFVLKPHFTREEQIFKDTDIFNRIKGEHELLRYISRLETKDVTLCNSMIPLGSCTMKLNSAFELEPLTSSRLNIHPFAPNTESRGYQRMISELAVSLCTVTGMDAVTFQSNSGATGEYIGLKVIKNFHASKGQTNRNVVLIPSSAHGTNPASAAKIGLKIVVVKADENGYVDHNDFAEKLQQHKQDLFGLMMTYPSTHGVFEEQTKELLKQVHECGGQVYIDGANMNAQMGLSSPGFVGGDVCHLNLHKTFCIPHGGGGPGMGPVLVKEHLSSFLPDHCFTPLAAFNSRGQQIAGAKDTQTLVAPFGSASILSISYLYIKGMGLNGLRLSSEQAIISANYLARILSKHYPVLYTNKNGYVAHEFILDIRPIKRDTGISEEDIAKRLMDFGFHAPTMSFPVAGTLMIEPTESENLDELNRFAEALIKIKEEIEKVKSGKYDARDNPLKNAPHTLEHLMADGWSHAYSREEAAFPLNWIRERGKIWPSVGRIDNIQGDRNLKTDF